MSTFAFTLDVIVQADDEAEARELHGEQLYRSFRARWLLERRDPPEAQA